MRIAPLQAPSLLALACLLAACLSATACGGGGDRDQARRPLRLHPDNPHYLLFRGRPTVLVTSGEHYRAVINTGFDYERYLDELARYGFNQTRLFSGTFYELESSSELGPEVSLAPRPGRLLLPWAQADERRPGGGRKWDLARWNPAYFERLRRFLAAADRRRIVVELVLFSALYDLDRWRASPFNAANNVNGVGSIDVRRLYTLENAGVLEFQDALVRKLVSELRSFDNLYYEVVNEGWLGPARASDRWQDHIIRTIEDAEADGPVRHLIARNYQHAVGPVARPHPSVSIFNFHYQRDLEDYRDLDGVLAFDETGFQGTRDRPYRTDAWMFMLDGGGIYSNLDWSFTPGREDGSAALSRGTPGGGSAALRRSLSVLKRFLERFDFTRMTPMHDLVVDAPQGATTRVLAEAGESYAVYLDGGRPGPLALEAVPGRYRVQWVDTRDGAVRRSGRVDHAGGELSLTPPPHDEDIALAIERAR